MEQAVYTITVDGQVIDSTIAPILISLSIKSDDKGAADELTLELDDSYGQIALPRMGASVTAAIGWQDDSLPDDEQGTVVQFEGTVDEAHSGGKHAKGDKPHHGGRKGGSGDEGGSGGPVHASGSRSKGRTLTITAKSADMTGKVKQRASRHADNMAFGDVAQQWGQKAGLSSVKVDAALSSVQRPYWAMAHESYMAWGQRMARELGATFKIFNTIAVFVPRSGGVSASGQALQDVDATWGENLIEWSASPILSRPQYGPFATRYYDPQAAQWQTATSSASGSGSATHAHTFKHATKDNAQHQSDCNKTEGDREQGGADSVTIDGEPTAQAGANCNISGVRPGVDGTYLISSVTHSISRHAGFTTHLSLKQPTGGAGADSRAAGSST